jgi:hypothetical protein
VGRKLEVLSAFAYFGRYIVPGNVQQLDEVPSEELEQYVTAGCLKITEQTEEVPAEELPLSLSLDEEPEDND